MPRPCSVLPWLALASLCVLPAAARAVPVQLPLGGACVAEMDERGVIRILDGKTPLVREIFVGTWVGNEFTDQFKAIKTAGAESQDGMVSRRGIIPRPGASSSFEVFARTTPARADGGRDLLLTFVLETPLFPKAKAAVLVRLPIAQYAGRHAQVDTLAVGAFPEKQAGKPFAVLRRDAHDLTIRTEEKPVLFIGRQDPGQILVQDARKWGAKAYEAQFHLMPTRSQPPSRRTVHLLVSLAGKRGPTLARIRTNRPAPNPDALPALPKYARFEITTDLWARFKNPYDARDITVTGVFAQPDQSLRRVRGFFYQDFERALERGAEKLTPLGPPQWRVRFTPVQRGKHAFKLVVKTKTGQLETPPQHFYVVDSDAPGFVRIHRQNKRFFQFTNGKTFFPVGHNACWGSKERLSYDYDDYFRRMESAGENYTRVWMCSWDTGIESARLDDYRLDAAWRLDYILARAEERGIYVKLCFDNAHDYTKPEKKKLFGCWKQNGGPCRTPLDLFTSAAAQDAYRRRLDYILARWGYSPHVMAWELWNEMNYVIDNDAKARPALVEWTRRMAGYLKDHDPAEHLVTTSLGLLTVWDDLWELDDIDFAQIHAYLPQPNAAKKPEERDAVLAVLRAGERVAHFGKPYHVSEFGYLDLEDVNRTNENDPGAIHLRNALWGSLFSGAAAAPSIWWWKQYVHAENLYRHYASVASFLHGIDPADKGWKRIVSAGASEYRVLGVKKRDQCALWIQKKGNHWYRRVAEKKPAEPLVQVTVRIPDVEGGEYRVSWWDTVGGKITSHRAYAARRPADPLKFDLVLERKTGAPDIAVKAEKVR